LVRRIEEIWAARFSLQPIISHHAFCEPLDPRGSNECSLQKKNVFVAKYIWEELLQEKFIFQEAGYTCTFRSELEWCGGRGDYDVLVEIIKSEVLI
jgi:hypothetical protein